MRRTGHGLGALTGMGIGRADWSVLVYGPRSWRPLPTRSGEQSQQCRPCVNRRAIPVSPSGGGRGG